MITLESILEECTKLGASDIHIKEGEIVVYRANGTLIKSSNPSTPNKINLFDFLYKMFYKKKERISYFKHNLEIDFGYTTSAGVSYRGNAYMYMGHIAIALRYVPDHIKNLVELDMPKSISRVLKAKQGLFLVTGPTGSGKSTTMASMIEAINEFRNEHIITVEDPIEYVFKSKQCIFSQREIGRDTLSYAQAIRSAMREDGDIIVIGEIRDAETMEVALGLAETGHLVFSTLHTSGSVQTMNRIIQFFPSEIESQIRTRLAESLLGVFSQRLIPSKDGTKRVAIRELMYVNSGIKNLILKGDYAQMHNTIEMNGREGMFSMRKYADSLRDAGVVEEKDYIGFFTNQEKSAL